MIGSRSGAWPGRARSAACLPARWLLLPALLVLVLSTSRAVASYPPLRDVEAWIEWNGTAYRVLYRVYDPQRGLWDDEGGGWYPGVGALTTTDGVVAWLEYDGSRWRAVHSVYDPVRRLWDEDAAGWYHGVGGLTTADGVVAWLETDGTRWRAIHAIYDPERRLWDGESSGWYHGVGALTTADGVVAWLETDDGTRWRAIYAIYDPDRRLWDGESSGWSEAVGSPTIEDATVTYWKDAKTYTRGYDPARGLWYDGPTKPLAHFHASPTSGAPPLWVWFTDMSIGGSSWVWSFGDGALTSERSPFHTYTSAGLFTATQWITGAGGSDSASVTIGTDVEAPTGSITINAGATYTNSASVTLSLSATDNSGTVSAMRFSNDDSTWSEWEPYATMKEWALSSGDGEKTVYVQFKDEAENVSSSYSDVIILDTTPPVVVSTSPLHGATDVSPDALIMATFSEAMAPATLNAATFTLVGGSAGSVAGTVTYESGTYTATLAPTDPLAPDDYTATIVDGPGGAGDAHGVAMSGDHVWAFTVPGAHGLSVTASAIPDTVASGGTCDLTATYEDSLGHGIASWSWDDGGAGGSFSPSPAVQTPAYVAPENTSGANITIDLTVTATCDGPEPLSDSDTAVLTVCSVLLAEFAGDTTVGCAPLTVCFTDLSSGSPTSWLWDFGDGYTSTIQHPCHVYEDEGDYTVSLTVSNGYGDDTEIKSSYVHVGASSLIGYWPFDGNGTDASGWDRDLSLEGGVGFAAGIFGQALDLHCDPLQYASRPIDDLVYDFGTGDFTVQAWVNFNNTSGQQTLVEKFEGQAGPGWSLTKIEDDSLRFCWGGLGNDCNSPPLAIASEVWHHILVRSQSGELEMFYDGERVASGCYPDIVDTYMPLLVGKRNYLDGRDFAVDGRMDEVAIWDRALSDPEIAYLFNDGLGNPVPTCEAQQTWFEDDDPAIVYTGAWWQYNHPAASAGHLKFSGQTGALAEFTFSGTGLRWHLAAGPMAGRARVYLDAVYLGTVDLYRPSLALVTLGKTGLALDTYTVAIEVAGTKNPSSTGYFVDIDAFEVVP